MLGDHAFKTQAAGIRKSLVRITGNVFGKLDGAIEAIKKVTEQVPAHREFRSCQVMPIEIHQIEGI
ncbi:hypothetical protein D3C71_1109460 [compost metagenome]